MSFLTAEWRKLAIANYEVDPKLLHPYLPAKTELDVWHNKHYVSLVGFLFKNTRVLGLPIPFHINFPEVNLRFYVRYKDQQKWKRGVVFIKEIVPKPAITFVANTLYKENYVTLPMRHHWEEVKDARTVKYEWKFQKTWQSIFINAEQQAQVIAPNSEVEFITEHYWGYTKINDQTTFEYEVRHPKWLHYPINYFDIQVDFGELYGKPFAFLNNTTPSSIMLAEGSAISVENKVTL